MILSLLIRELLWFSVCTNHKTKAFINSVNWLKHTFYINSLLPKLMSQSIKI